MGVTVTSGEDTISREHWVSCTGHRYAHPCTFEGYVDVYFDHYEISWECPTCGTTTTKALEDWR